MGAAKLGQLLYYTSPSQGFPSLNAGLGLSSARDARSVVAPLEAFPFLFHHPCICDRLQEQAVYQQRVRGAGCSAQSVCGHESGHARPWRQRRPGSQLPRPVAKGRRCVCGRRCCLTSLKSLECAQRCTCTYPCTAASCPVQDGALSPVTSKLLSTHTCLKHCAVVA